MKRLIMTASAVFERFVDQVENHEAVAESLIHQVATCAAQLKVQGSRLDEEIKRLDAERTAQHSVRERWRERAASLADDEARALECVRRMRTAERQEQSLTRQLAEQQNLRDQLGRDLEKVEVRLRALNLRKTSLSARGARSRALGVQVDADPTIAEGLFDRWEAQVVRDEYCSDGVALTGAADEFEQGFEAAEDEADLRAMLATIAKEAKS